MICLLKHARSSSDWIIKQTLIEQAHKNSTAPKPSPVTYLMCQIQVMQKKKKEMKKVRVEPRIFMAVDWIFFVFNLFPEKSRKKDYSNSQGYGIV
jgi:hypothetical protein